MEELTAQRFEPPRVDPFWLILQRLDDVRREQDRLRQHVDERIGELRQEMGQLRQEQHRLREELHQEMGQLRQELKELRQELNGRLGQLVGWFIAGLVAVLGTIVGMGWIIGR